MKDMLNWIEKLNRFLIQFSIFYFLFIYWGGGQIEINISS